MPLPSYCPLDITIVIPTYNRSRWIARALASLQNQTRPPSGVVVVDDGSSDDTVQSVETWSRRSRFPVRVVRLPTNVGPASARNYGIQLAATRFVGFLDSDDEYLPDALETLVAAADRFPDAALSFADATVVSADTTEPHGLFQPKVQLEKEASRRTSDPEIYELTSATSTLLKASIIPTSATCFLRKAALRVGGMPEGFRAGEDWLFWLRLSTEGPFVFQMRDVVRHHRHPDNLTHPDSAESTAREKLRGYIELERGIMGVPLSDDQRRALRGHIVRQARSWRYNLSRLGLRNYSRGIRSDVGRSLGSPIHHVLDDPRSVLRAAYWSVNSSGKPDAAVH